MLLQSSLSHTASPTCSRVGTSRASCLKSAPVAPLLSKQHLRGQYCRTAAAAADQPEPAAAHEAAPAQQPSQDVFHERPQLEEMQQAEQQQIGLPPGPMEPPDEEPKKLSAAARLSDELASTSIIIFGDDTDLNWAVCQALAKKIGWFPVLTRKVLTGLEKVDSLDQLISRDGRDAVVAAEAKMLKGMRDQLRCCIATLGDGAAADATLYPNLYGTILIWLDEEDKRSPKAPSPVRALYQQQAEVCGKVEVRKGGFGEKAQTLEEKAATVASRLIKAMLQLLKDNKDLLARKRLYIEFGCRGDWPELRPEDWNPVLEGLDRKAVS